MNLTELFEPQLWADARPLFAFAGATALASLVLCGLASALGLVTDRVEARSNHADPVSRAGGVVIALCFGVAGLFWSVTRGLAPDALNLLVLVVIAALLGFLDDRKPMRAGIKLIALALVSALIVLATGPVPGLPVPLMGWIALSPAVGTAIAFLWVIGFVNAFNFMDGLNGMAAVTGAALLTGVGILGAAQTGGASLYILCLAASAALFGFAVLNIGRGRPFLGDAGSLGLGALIAGGALAAAQLGGEAAPFAALPLLVTLAAAIPFVGDVALTLLRRAREGERLSEAHSQHAYQRLFRAGRSHQAVAAAYGLAAWIVMAVGVGLALWGEASVWMPWALGLAGLALWRLGVLSLARGRPGYAARATEDSASASSLSRTPLGGSAASDAAASSAYA